VKENKTVATVLVVDDSAVDRRLVTGLLRRKGGLDVDSANDGCEALEMIRLRMPDLVVTDLRMPNMDGLELVRNVRRQYPSLPVILITSMGSEEIAAEALRQGAASYVPKRSLGKDLVDTVRHVLSVAALQRTHARLMGRMSRIEYDVVLDNDWSLVDPLVRYIEDGVTHLGFCDDTDRMRIGVALREALLNAIYHGNLEVSSDLREGDGEAYRLLAVERSKQSPYRDRRVYVDTKLSQEEAMFTIRDEGKGFNVAALPDPRDPSNLEKASGRGVLLIRMFMDDVTYNASGNQVTLVKRADADHPFRLP
jgi:CheY-like chemotaxis protein/anti-sigma regulatory factor (Ser/Thr protein kinase)